MVKRDYYEVLGLDRNADQAAIKKAYRNQAMKHHPDKNPGDSDAAETMKEMTDKGYEVALKMERAVDSLDQILDQVRSGEGTIGNLVYNDELYTDLRDMVKDLKANPWKLFHKSREVKKKTEDKGAIERKQGEGGYF